MGIIQDIRGSLKAAADRAEAAHKRNIAIANAKSRSEIAHAKTELQRENAKLKLAREKADINKQLAQAKADIAIAKAESNRSRIAAGNLTVGERIAKMGRDAGNSGIVKGLSRDAQKAGKSLFTSKPVRRKPASQARPRSASSREDLFDNSDLFGGNRKVTRKPATKRKTVKRKTR